ncbi:MAG: TIGR04283 family arsenosugar biosynthesis glycosyltransferase [Pseudomonadales bacterium]
MAPPLSIIIPTLNEARNLPSLLRALAPARARGAEVLVVDGGSEDETVALAEGLGVTVLRAEGGRGPQLAKGAEAAGGAVLWFLHADSTIEAVSDLHLLTGLAEHRRRWGFFSIRILGRHPALALIWRMMNLRSRLSGMGTGDQGLFVTRDALAAVGGVPPLPLMEDLALAAALKATQGPPLCLRKRLRTDGRRWESQGVWKTVLLMWRLRWAYFRGADPARLAARYRASDSA